MLEIVSENFIHALLLFLGLFLKISRWVPLTKGLFTRKEGYPFATVTLARGLKLALVYEQISEVGLPYHPGPGSSKDG